MHAIMHYSKSKNKNERHKEAQPEAVAVNPQPIIHDSWEIKDDGTHISEIFGKRSSWLSKELNTRATYDNLTYLVKQRERYLNGVTIQDGPAFPLEETCRKINTTNNNCPILCINGIKAFEFFDMIGMEMTKQFNEALSFFENKPEIYTIMAAACCDSSDDGNKGAVGSSINMLNENSKEWHAQVAKFINEKVV